MRSAHLRAGLTRVVQLGEKTIANRSGEGIAVGWWLLLPVGAVLTVLLVATWHAGQQSGQLDGQHLSAEIDLLTQKIASNQLELEAERKKNAELEQALKATGKNPNLGLVTQLRQQLLQAQADANQYKTILEREHQESSETQMLIEALSLPGARLLPMKISQAGGDCKAYALLAANGRLVLIASRLPVLPETKQFQLWVLRKQEPKVVSAGVFNGDENRHVLMTFDDPSTLMDMLQLKATEEPQGGSSEPMGEEIFETVASEKLE